MYNLIYVSFNLLDVKVKNELDSLWDVDKMIIKLDMIQKLRNFLLILVVSM